MLRQLLRERKNLLQLALIILLGMSESGLLLWQISCIKDVFDCAVNGDHNLLISALIRLGILVLVTTAVRYTVVYCRDLFSVRFRNGLSISLFDKFLSSEHRGTKEMHSGDVMSRIVQDIVSVTTFFSDALPSIVSNVFLLVGAFIYLCVINYKIALCVTVIAPLFILFGKLFLKKADYYTREVRSIEAQSQALFQEVVQNKLIIKVNRTMGYVLEQYKKLAIKMESSVVNRTRYNVKMNFMMALGLSAGYLVTLGWGCLLLVDGVITIGEMAAILQLSDRIQNPARVLSDLIPQYASFLVARRRLKAIHQMAPEKGNVFSIEPPLGISFEKVSFTYADSGKTVLHDFSFNFKPNCFTIVKGESGVGKTTLVNLILSVYRPDSGNILAYDSQKEVPLTPGIRDFIEYVPQGNHMLSGTIEENLRLGNPDASHAEMEDALRIACADFVLSSKDGLFTLCAEKGVGFSEGQAQRILIARALLRKRPILILDEATSALDDHTERLLMSNLMSMTSKTVIFITHKRHLESVADAVLTL